MLRYSKEGHRCGCGCKYVTGVLALNSQMQLLTAAKLYNRACMHIYHTKQTGSVHLSTQNSKAYSIWRAPAKTHVCDSCITRQRGCRLISRGLLAKPRMPSVSHLRFVNIMGFQHYPPTTEQHISLRSCISVRAFLDYDSTVRTSGDPYKYLVEAQ